MDSKKIFDSSGISRKVSIVLLIIGYFLAFNDVYNNIMMGTSSFILADIFNLLLFLVLIYYAFIGFRKNETHFKIVIYFFIISILINIISIFINIGSLSAMVSDSLYYIAIFTNIIQLILVCYFVYNLNNYNKAKISILLVVLIDFILWILMTIINGFILGISIPKLIIFLIPSVSIALFYIARYNKEGFKQLNK